MIVIGVGKQSNTSGIVMLVLVLLPIVLLYLIKICGNVATKPNMLFSYIWHTRLYIFNIPDYIEMGFLVIVLSLGASIEESFDIII